MSDDVTREVYQIDNTQALRALTDISTALREMREYQERAKEGGEAVEKGFLESAAAVAVGQAAYEGLKWAISETLEVMKDSVAAALDAEQAEMKRARALRNAGVDVEKYTAELNEHAEALERLTGVDDEYYKGLQTMLATMGVAPEQLNKFTDAALDLAAATGTDAMNAAKLLARAHAEGKDELKKYGIAVDEAAFKAKGFGAVIEEVQRKFGGMHSEIPEQTKAMNALHGAWETFKESLGATLLKLFDTSGALAKLTELVDRASKFMDPEGTTYGNKSKERIEHERKYLMVEKQNLEDHLNGQKTMWLTYGATVEEQVAIPFERAQQMLADVEKQLNETSWMGGLDKAGKGGGFKEPGPSKKDREHAAKEAAKHIKELAKEEANIRKEMAEADAHAQKEYLKDELHGQDEAAKESVRIEKERLAEIKKATDDVNKWLAQVDKEEAAAQKKLNDEKLEEEKKFYEGLLDEAKRYAMQALNFLGSMIEEQLTQNETYNKAYHEALVARRVADSQETDAKKTAVEVEKELQQEAKAAQEKRTAEFLAGIAKEAGMKAILEAAEALASLAKYDYPGAAQHGIAAAAFGGVALAAGVAAVGISGGRGMTREEKDSIADLNERKKEKEERAAKVTEGVGPGQTVNQYFFGISGMKDVGQASEVDRLARLHATLQTGA